MIKSLIDSELLQTHHNLSMDIIVVSNALNYEIRSVISHIFPDGRKKAKLIQPNP